MCGLLGISSGQTSSWREILCAFRQRGGGMADNPDGWGVAYRKDGELRLEKEPVPAVQSLLFEELCQTVRSDLVVAHVRKARLPPVNTYGNTHPFQHICCGRQWVFAHNGLVPAVIDEELASPSAVCRPDGATDSEHAFCRMLGTIAKHFTQSDPGSPDSWFSTVAGVSELVAAHGKFNFLMSDGEHLIAYGHDRLHHLQQRVSSAGSEPLKEAAVIATEPLTDHDDWHPFEPGELRIYRRGRLVDRIRTAPPPVQQMPAQSRSIAGPTFS
jgi:predicted glutamine amidotransferase